LLLSSFCCYLQFYLSTTSTAILYASTRTTSQISIRAKRFAYLRRFSMRWTTYVLLSSTTNPLLLMTTVRWTHQLSYDSAFVVSKYVTAAVHSPPFIVII
uniref:RRM domain-containing protein n=1 Tax=Parascaris univalens TaxID=6257 RepID=A0A914ZQC2_PARUN